MNFFALTYIYENYVNTRLQHIIEQCNTWLGLGGFAGWFTGGGAGGCVCGGDNAPEPKPPGESTDEEGCLARVVDTESDDGLFMIDLCESSSSESPEKYEKMEWGKPDTLCYYK